MSDKKEYSTMGLPRASGKRRWSGDGDDDDDQSPSKAVCTSPPYAQCAEDVLPHPPPPHRLPPPPPSSPPSLPSAASSAMTEVTRLVADDEDECHLDDDEDDVLLSDPPPVDDDDDDDDDDDENFIDDEEDKDSGFIDGNSIDNSSDDDSDAKGDSSFASSSSSSSAASASKDEDEETSAGGVAPPADAAPSPVAPATLPPETDLQISLAKVLPCSSSSSSHLPTTSTTCVTTCSSPNCSLLDSASSPLRPAMDVKGDLSSITTVTAAQTGTIVTSAYQGSVPSPTYDLHSYPAGPAPSGPPGPPSSYPPELYQNRPCAPSWSCTFYDGSQPTTTNKYMEISPNRSLTSQSIQCDENGKSYLELGSASPYTNTYTNECGNFTTSPSTYNGSSYSQTFSGAPAYASGNTYFNNRPNYGPNSPYGYHGAESYNTYDGEGGCSYSYVNGNYVSHNPGRAHGVPNRIQPQRCSSPICDPTRTSPRPACYQQQRLSVLNMSMFKLNRFSRFPEPSLHRSVLICNTLRHIEREMEAEGVSMAAILAHSHSYGTHGQNVGGAPPTGVHCPDTMPSMPSTNPLGEGPLPSLHSPLIGAPIQPPLPPSTPPPSTLIYSNDSSPSYSPPPPYSHHDSRDSPLPFEHPRDSLPLRAFSPPPPTSGDRQPLLPPSDALPEDDPEGMVAVPSQRLCEDRTEGINWCSVLTLSSQTDLDSMNNNECHEWNNEGDVGTAPPPPPPATTTAASLTPLTPLISRGTLNHQQASTTSNSSMNGVCMSSNSSSTTTNTTTSPASTPLQYPPLPSEESTSATPNWKLPSLSADDVLKSFPEPARRQEEDLDSIIKVLVGS